MVIPTGHCLLLGIPTNDFCRSCVSKEDEETVFLQRSCHEDMEISDVSFSDIVDRAS